MGEERCSHRIKKPLAPQSLIFWDGCCGVDIVLYLEGYNFAIRERFKIELIYATVIRGLSLQILVIWTICGE
jgi:hypothetical protein